MGSGCSTQNSVKINQDNEPQPIITNENIDNDNHNDNHNDNDNDNDNDTQSIITNSEIQPAIVIYFLL